MKSRGGSLKSFVVMAVAVLALASCHSSKNSTTWEDPIYAKHPDKEKKEQKSESKGSGNIRKVIDAACDWIGVPYLYGGNTRKGVDCSGLVCMAFETGAGIRLPRSSSDQAEACRKVKRSAVKPGDLFFFTNKKGGGRINHVALYIGDNRVVHSTTSRGVIISNLDEDYWQSHFHSCGRVIE